MAIYRLFAEKDATIYSDQPLLNSGLDPILELSKTNQTLNPSHSSAARVLIQYSTADINRVVQTYIPPSASFDADLRLFLAHASSLPLTGSIIVHQLYESWDAGTGRLSNIPVTKDGVSWSSKNAHNAAPWLSQSQYPTGVTGSYLPDNPGGGSWYTESVSWGFEQYLSKDIKVSVSPMIAKIVSGSVVNNGFILKNDDAIEFDANYLYDLKYFSRDTNTIYPPILVIKWDDYSFVTGSSVPAGSNVNVTISNNRGKYEKNNITTFRVNVVDKYPSRTFQTGSLYTSNKYLNDACYSLIDNKTGEVVIDFDSVYTKLSVDTEGNYFKLYMDSLESARYYKILIKANMTGGEEIFDPQCIFKIV